MSMKYEYLEELKNNFITALQSAVKCADNEDDMDELDAIAEDTICELPIEIIQKDYWTRSAIKSRMVDIVDEKQQDTNYINRFMKYLYNEDAIYIGDYATQNIDECYEEFVEQENKGE